MEMLGGVFDAGDAELVDNVAGDTDDEDVSETLIEEDFGADAAIGASHNDRVRNLSFGDFFSG